MDWEFWANWGIAGVFAGTLLIFLLKSTSKRLDRIEETLENAMTMLVWLYTKHDGHPIGLDHDGEKHAKD